MVLAWHHPQLHQRALKSSSPPPALSTPSLGLRRGFFLPSSFLGLTCHAYFSLTLLLSLLVDFNLGLGLVCSILQCSFLVPKFLFLSPSMSLHLLVSKFPPLSSPLVLKILINPTSPTLIIFVFHLLFCSLLLQSHTLATPSIQTANSRLRALLEGNVNGR